MNIKTIIIEDEPMASKAMERFCQRHPRIELIRSYLNPKKALTDVGEMDIDLFLLDIEMPEMTGLEFLEQLPFHPDLIFTTSHPNYAYAAFEHHVIDFLKKPISYGRFEQAIQKVINKANIIEPELDKNSQNFYIKDGSKLTRIDSQNILYFENAGDYVKIIQEDKSYVIYSTMKVLESKLRENLFFRVHRSYLVNLTKIKDIEESTMVINRKVIPISRAKRPLLLQKINLL